MIKTDNNIHKKEIRFDSIGKIKTSLYSSPIEDEILQEMVLNLDLIYSKNESLAGPR